MSRHPRSRRLALAAAGLAAVAAVATPTSSATATASGPRLGGGGDAIVSLPAYDDVPAYASRGGVNTPIPGAGNSSARIVTGQFDGDPGGDAIVYRPAGAPDLLVHLTSSGAGVSPTTSPLSIGGAFRPVVGDFDGNGIDDIIWYAPGTARDYLWRFDAAGTITSSRLNIDGSYRPTALDANGDGRTDVLWYGPGSTPDRLWLMGPSAVPTTKAVTIGGDYQVVVGPFGLASAGQPTDRVVFYNPSGTDWLWTFDAAGDHKSYLLPNVDGAYTLLGGQFIEEAYGTLFFYGPGTLPERLWAFGPPPADVSEQEAPPQVTNTYAPITGDYNADGLTDIAWVGDKIGNRLWTFQFDGTVAGSPLHLALRPRAATVEMD